MPDREVDLDGVILPARLCQRHEVAMAGEFGPDGMWRAALVMFSTAAFYYATAKGEVWKGVDDGDIAALNTWLKEIGCLACHIGEARAVQARAEVVSVVNRTYRERPVWLPPKKEGAGASG